MKPLIVIPTYNEKENIEKLVREIFSLNLGISILVVDDNSPDGTLDIVKDLTNEFNNLFYLHRENKQGLAAAYIAGFKWGMNQGFDVLCEMDADFSHDTKYLKPMLEKIQDNDFVVASRNIKGGGVEGWPLIRKIISKGGSLYSRFILDFIPIHDLTGGYNMWTIDCLEKINLDSIISTGYCFQIEMKYRAFKQKCKGVEIPIIFKDRQYGKSKMDNKIFIEALLKIWELRFKIK